MTYQEVRGMAKRLRASTSGAGLVDAPAFGRAASQATAKDATVSFFAIDLDDLHSLNTDVGRPAGDRFIRGATQTLERAAAQEKWTVGRIGGDEFTVLLPGVT